MDTKSTKFNLRFIVKIIAVILALAVVGLSAKTAIDSFIYIDNYSNDDDYFIEGAFATNENDFFTSNIFENELRYYTQNLFDIIINYGDGSEDFYKEKHEYTLSRFDTFQTRLIKNLYYRSNVRDHSYVEKGILFLADQKVLSIKQIEATNETNIDESFYLSSTSMSSVLSYNCSQTHYTDYNDFDSADFEANVKEASKYSGDFIADFDLVKVKNSSGDGTADIYGGRYAVTVNSDALKKELTKIGYLDENDSYEAFSKKYNSAVNNFDKTYRNINYIISNSDGLYFSNITDYPVRITDYDFYLTGESGSLSSNFGTNFHLNGNGYLYKSGSDYIYDTVLESTTSIAVTMPDGIVATTTPYTAEEVSKPSQIFYSYDSNIDEMENYDVSIFFNEDAVFTISNMTVSQMKDMFMQCGLYARTQCIKFASGVLIFLILLVLLIILSGRRSKEDTSVYLMPTDKIFFELKLLIDGGAIFLLGLLFIYCLDGLFYVSSGFLSFIYRVLPLIAMVIAAFLIDFILYLTKLFKAHRFFKSLFIVWFFTKPPRFIKKIFTLFFSTLKKMLLFPYKSIKKLYEKATAGLYYAKDLEKIVKIKTAILVGLNGISILYLLATTLLWNGIDNGGELFILALLGIPTVLCDIYAIYRGLKFVGGVNRLVEVIKEYRKGNLDSYINRAAIPEYLIPAAEDLESLGDGLRLAVEEAVKQETTKTELITNISHDLKTPLTSIINYVELLKQCDINNETALSYLEVLGEKSDRLKYLISDLVEASKAATGNIKVDFVKVSLRELVSQITGEHSDAFEERQLNIVYDMPENDITVKADSKLLYRVLENLVVNVKKYAMPGTRVYISAEKNDNKGIITIKNISNAPLNITAEQLKQRFVRGDASRTTEGNGLGLSIAENLCILQNGKLDLEIVGDLFIAKVEFPCI